MSAMVSIDLFFPFPHIEMQLVADTHEFTLFFLPSLPPSLGCRRRRPGRALGTIEFSWRNSLRTPTISRSSSSLTLTEGWLVSLNANVASRGGIRRCWRRALRCC